MNPDFLQICVLWVDWLVWSKKMYAFWVAGECVRSLSARICCFLIRCVHSVLSPNLGNKLGMTVFSQLLIVRGFWECIFISHLDSNAIRREHKHCISLASTGNGDKQLLFSSCPLLHTILCLLWSFDFSQEWMHPVGYREETSFLVYSIISSEPALILPPSSLSFL